MLPVVICERNAALRGKWMDLLTDVIRREYPSLRTEAMLGEEKELSRMVQFETGIMLVVLAVDREIDRCVELYGRVMARNRDNYVLLCLHDIQHLNAVLSKCLRPAGILVDPFREEQMRRSMREILGDYVAQYAPEEADEAMTVFSGKTMHRIRYRDICYLEAQDKLVNLCLGRKLVAVRGSLAAFERELSEDFIRCHRGYIVNRRYIESLDRKNLLLSLKDGQQLPVSRSCRDALIDALREE